MGDAAQLGRTLDGDVVSHEPDEGDPDAERRSAVHEGLVTLGEVKLLPRLRRRHFGTPATMKLSLQAPRARRLGHYRSGDRARRPRRAHRRRRHRGSVSRQRPLRAAGTLRLSDPPRPPRRGSLFPYGSVPSARIPSEGIGAKQ